MNLKMKRKRMVGRNSKFSSLQNANKKNVEEIISVC